MSASKSTNGCYTPVDPGDEIVISGIAGRFPDSDNMELLKKNLFNKVDLISEDDRRWNLHHPSIPRRTGKISNIEKFDALFFGVHFKQAQTMDPMCRMLLEHAYEAVVDAGINPKQLRGSRTGVFIGSCFSESEKTWFYEKLQMNGFGITGCSKAMMANRISYWLGVSGPSYCLDSACSSGLVALEHAYRNIQDGQCDDAIVGAANLCLHPYISLQFSRLGVLSPDGRCKSFDADADGYCRSEAISVIYLQKAKNAKRIYATLVHSKKNCDGYKEQGITFPSCKMQYALLKECYEECGIPSSSLSYMECHATGNRAGDSEEINAMDKAFGKSRTAPLLIGSVKSNLGHAEPASGLCQIAKVIIAMESGIIPPNLNYNQPRKGLKALEEGRFKVVTELTPWEGGYVGISSFGFGGANCHVLLKSNTKEKINNGAPLDDLPRLLAVSGRTEEAVKVFLDDIERHPVDVEYIRLLHDVHTDDIQGHMYRGYTIIDPKKTVSPIRETENYLEVARPIWFVFSGMGSQWPGMGVELMKFPIFVKAIQKCDAVLRPRGVDIINILTTKDKSIFNNILHSFVGIAAVQIGLVDLLATAGIVPNNMIGHSVGELGCAYADGTFTAEQMILSAYSRGLASIETEVIYGSMAAVGLGHEDIKDMCPPDIDVACHNSVDSSTISGPAESMKEFVAQLQAKKIFAKEVPCSNIPYHSRYIQSAGPRLLAYMNEVVSQPKPRSQKWVSTSVPQNKWSTASAKLSSAEYHTNNLLSPVLFEEVTRLIPKDAVTIEIAPHGLLQAILRRSLGSKVTNIALTKRGHKDNSAMFLQAIGKLYNIGLQPNIANLYPPVEFPVSRGTPMISPSIRWEHSDEWHVTTYRTQKKITSGQRNIDILLTNKDDEYMAGYVIDGKISVPITAYLIMAWETLGTLRGETYTELSVIFENITFIRTFTHIPKDGEVKLTLMLQKGTGRFEVSENNSAIVTGFIRATSNPAQEKILAEFLSQDNEEEVMTSKDIYKELRLRGYQYSGAFCALKSASPSYKQGHISWMDNWVTFLDNMLQMMILQLNTRDLYAPAQIEKLVIDTKLHQQTIQEIEDKQFPASVYQNLNTVVSSGIEIRGVRAVRVFRQPSVIEPVLEEYKFVAHRDEARVSLQEAIRLAAHIALEYHQTLHVKTVELIDDSDNVTIQELASPVLTKVLDDLSLIQANVLLTAPSALIDSNALPSNVNIVDANKLSKDEKILLAVGIGLLTQSKSDKLQQILSILRDGGFVLTRETSKSENLSAFLSNNDLDLILEKSTGKEKIMLLKKRVPRKNKTEIIRVNNREFSWLEKLNSIMNARNITDSLRIILVGEGDLDCGLLGFVNSLRKELGGEMIRGVLIQDENAPKFSPRDLLYAEQLRLDLPLNVLRPGKIWGSYRYQALPSSLKSKLVHHAFVEQKVCDDLSSLRWVEGPIRADSNHDDLIRVVYSPINSRDILFATGKLVTDATTIRSRFDEDIIGLEYVGIDTAGRRVMGISGNRNLTNLTVPDRNLCWNVPDDWSLEDAATVPCAYTICYYALYMHGNMKRNDKVLIHSGTNDVSQAAIHLALHEDCEIFTTVDTTEKRNFIRKMFPSIPDDHIGNSCDTSFEHMILEQTENTGVNIVLNSLTDEKLQASVRCLAQGGRFLEIGTYDVVSNNTLGMMIFLKEISFQGVVLDNIINSTEDVVNQKTKLHEFLEKGLENGSVKPLNRKVFEKDELETAFRYMTAGEHMGKVMLKICDEKNLKTSILAQPRYYCNSEKSYVILGGLGGFGLELADWLILRGARNLVLTSRAGIRTGYQRMRVDLWKSYGVNVLITTGADAANYKDCEFILRSAEKRGPVDAIFNLAVVSNDGICENQTPQSFEESFKPKARSTKILDELSRKLCPQLRQFVVFSSVSCGRGNVGQTNYNMANSVMERICERRVANGLPGLAIQWGAIGDIDPIAERQDEHFNMDGMVEQEVSSCLEKLEMFLLQDRPIVASTMVAKKCVNTYGTTNIVETVANVMGIKDVKNVAQNVPLAELGLDSTVAMKIKQMLERELDLFFTALDIRNLNFAKLSEIYNKETKQEKSEMEVEEQSTEVPNMHLLIRIIDNEDISSEVCVKLPTKKDPRKVEIFLLPGIEGYGNIFNPIVSKIRPTVYCLQYGISNVGLAKSIPEYADYLLPYILPKAEERRSFSLVGYSYGSLIAIELARRLEDHGLTGQLLLIDGSPDLVKSMINHLLPSFSKEELQNNVLLAVMNVLQPSASRKMVPDLEKCTSWEQKLDSFVSHIATKNMSLSVENQKALCTSFYKNILALQMYDASSLPQIRTPITLLKPTIQSIPMIEKDYGLRKITRNVKVHYIEGDHLTMLNNVRVAAAINGEPMIDPKTFDEYIRYDGPLEYEVEDVSA